MNKLTKLLSVFVLAGAIGAGAGALAGCGHKHTFSEDWSKDATQHWHAATCEHGDEKSEVGDHVDSDNNGKCDVCDYTMTTPSNPNTPSNPSTSGVTAPAGLTGLTVEGVTQTYNLTTAAPEANISLENMKVYFQIGSTKGDEVAAANYTAELYNEESEKLDSMEHIRTDGEYSLVVTLKDVTGATDEYGEIAIKVNNPIESIALDTESDPAPTLTQTQGEDTISSTWKFKATRANGDKEDVDVVLSGVDTLQAGEDKEATATHTASGKTCTVTYTITANAELAVQSHAFNAASLAVQDYAKGATTDLSTSIPGLSLTASSDKQNKVADQERVNGTKQFTKRISMGGAWASNANSIKFTNLNTIAGLAQGATVKSHITLYGISSGAEVRVLGIGKEGAEGAVATWEQGQAIANKDSKIATKVEFDVTGAGTFHIACVDASNFDSVEGDTTGQKAGGWYFYYIQVDTIINGDSAQSDIPLAAGEDKAYKLDATYTGELNDSDELHVNAGTQWDAISGDFQFNVIKVNSVTCEASEAELQLADIQVTGNDFASAGKKTVTFSYESGGATVTDTYTVYVDSAVSGITGAKISLDTALVTEVAEAGQTITLKLEHIKPEMEGENAQATATVESATYKKKDNTGDATNITADGVQVGEGEYVITATVKVSIEGGASAEFTATCDLTVKVHSDKISWFYQEGRAEPAAEDPEYAADTKIIDEGSFTAEALVRFVGAKNSSTSALFGKVPKVAAANAAGGEELTFTNGIASKEDATGKDNVIRITAKKAITIYVYVSVSDSKHGSDKKGSAITYTKNSEAKVTISQPDGCTKVTAVKVDLAEADVLIIGADAGSGGTGRLWLFGIEAVEKATD